MPNKEMRKLRRAELIDIIYRLRVENEELEEKNQKLTEQLADRTIALENVGSIAEGALALNGVFEAAQRAADQYVLSAKQAYADLDRKVREAEQQCKQMIEDAEKQAEKVREDALCERGKILAEADRCVEEKWNQFQEKTAQIINEHAELQRILSTTGK